MCRIAMIESFGGDFLVHSVVLANRCILHVLGNYESHMLTNMCLLP